MQSTTNVPWATIVSRCVVHGHRPVRCIAAITIIFLLSSWRFDVCIYVYIDVCMYVWMDVIKASEKDVCFRTEEPNHRASSDGGPGQFLGFILAPLPCTHTQALTARSHGCHSGCMPRIWPRQRSLTRIWNAGGKRATNSRMWVLVGWIWGIYFVRLDWKEESCAFNQSIKFKFVGKYQTKLHLFNCQTAMDRKRYRTTLKLP